MIEFKNLRQENENWIVKTTNGKEFNTPNVVIAGGVGSFEPENFQQKVQKSLMVLQFYIQLKTKLFLKINQ